jgi:hypothetical protein
MGIEPAFAARQQAVISAYERLGVILECPTPYYHDTSLGDHLAGQNHQRSVTPTRSSGHGQTGRGDRVRLLLHLLEKLPVMDFILTRTENPI